MTTCDLPVAVAAKCHSGTSLVLFDCDAGHRMIDLRSIADMDIIFAREQSPGRVLGPRHEAFSQSPRKRLRQTVHGHSVKLLAVVEVQAVGDITPQTMRRPKA